MKHIILILLLTYINSQTAGGQTKLPYDYTESNWPEICKIGIRQTPIDVKYENAQLVKNNTIISILSNNYSTINSGALTLYDNEKYGLDLAGTDSLWVLKNGIPYQYFLLGFHFHFASEHTVNGKSMDLELHLVHGKNKDAIRAMNITDPDTNDFLVVGVMYKTSPNASNNPIIQRMNPETRAPISQLDFTPYVRPTKNFYHYSGSLTTPGCVEKVNWILMDDVEIISESQFNSLKSWIQNLYPKGNARTVKPLNGRTLYYIQNSSASGIKVYLMAMFIALILIIS